jgi:hypothetical protein
VQVLDLQLIMIDKNSPPGEASIQKRGGGKQEQNTSKYRELHGKQMEQKKNPLDPNPLQGDFQWIALSDGQR